MVRLALGLVLVLFAEVAVAYEVTFDPADNDVDVEEFLEAFNDYRERSGLPPVQLSVALTDDAAQNNELQARHGLDHHYMGRASAQNSAWNYPDVAAVLSGWHGSAGHRANMRGNWTCMGIHKRGPYWTQNFSRWTDCR